MQHLPNFLCDMISNMVVSIGKVQYPISLLVMSDRHLTSPFAQLVIWLPPINCAIGGINSVSIFGMSQFLAPLAGYQSQ